MAGGQQRRLDFDRPDLRGAGQKFGSGSNGVGSAG